MDLPAIMFCGPPHSGKSTLSYRLSQQLQAEGCAHYLLRASPDGEGQWTHEAPPDLVRELRRRGRGQWTPQLAAALADDVAQRQLPFLVDAGGRPSAETEHIAAQCSHGVILAAEPEAIPQWRAVLKRQGVTVLAELRSTLTGPQTVAQPAGPLRGVLTGLDRERTSDGPCFEALLAVVRPLLALDVDALYHIHAALANRPAVLRLEGDVPGVGWRDTIPSHRWQPEDLAPLLAATPPCASIALYGRAPGWVYGALAAHVDEPPGVFDARWGWLELPRLSGAEVAPPSSPLVWDAGDDGQRVRLRFALPEAYLVPADRDALAAPPCPLQRGVLLDGKLPLWLTAALVRHFRAAHWVAVRQPQVQGAVVVATQQPKERAIGAVIAV